MLTAILLTAIVLPAFVLGLIARQAPQPQKVRVRAQRGR